MNNFIDKKALIIGASGGMGSAVASMLSKNGVHCFLVGRSQEKLNDIFQLVLHMETLVFIIPVIFQI